MTINKSLISYNWLRLNSQKKNWYFLKAPAEECQAMICNKDQSQNCGGYKKQKIFKTGLSHDCELRPDKLQLLADRPTGNGIFSSKSLIKIRFYIIQIALLTLRIGWLSVDLSTKESDLSIITILILQTFQKSLKMRKIPLVRKKKLQNVWNYAKRVTTVHFSSSGQRIQHFFRSFFLFFENFRLIIIWKACYFKIDLRVMTWSHSLNSENAKMKTSMVMKTLLFVCVSVTIIKGTTRFLGQSYEKTIIFKNVFGFGIFPRNEIGSSKLRGQKWLNSKKSRLVRHRLSAERSFLWLHRWRNIPNGRCRPFRIWQR